MEEVQVIDCPPTPEMLLPSVTPPPRALLLEMLDSSSAEELDNYEASGEGGSSSIAGQGETASGRNSPPPKCAICLGKCRQKCYTDSCRHQFCYRCLLEWSKIKAECPLCKQVFRSIIYNQKTSDRYQEHMISIVPPSASPSSAARTEGQGSASGSARSAGPQVYHRLDFTLTQPPRFTYSATLRVQPSQSERLQQLFLHQSGDVQRFSREFPDDTIPSRQSGPEWRRYIYHRRLHARPLPDINGRMRECSAAFYSENPAQIHRLMPWINRELIALCRGNPAQVTMIMEDVPNLLLTHDITSTVFRERVSYWGRARTAHFIHELLNFARSPYDMIGYDRCVQYDPYINSVVVVTSSSSSSSGSETEDDVVRVVEPAPGTSSMMDSANAGTSSGSRRGRTQFTIETRSSDQTVIMTGSFGGAGVSGIVSVSTSGTQTGSSGLTGSSIDLSRMHPLTSLVPQNASRLEDGENISLSSSDSDDCRIVGALKPPHLRTPEMVSLESESDSDVVFVNEDQTARAAGVIPMDSNAVLDQLFPNELLNVDLSKFEGVASTSEYNNGASTSSGGGGSMRKFYARPRVNRHSQGIGFKSIYEASDTDDSNEPVLTTKSESSSHDEVKFNIRSPVATSAVRKRKVTKRSQNILTTSNDSSDESSTSDSESKYSSTSSSTTINSNSSSSSDSDSDSDFQSDEPPAKKRSRRSKKHTSRKTSKRHRKESKKRSKSKKRKTSISSNKRNKRKRQRVTPKAMKTSSESGKGTSASCNSIPSSEIAAVSSGRHVSPPKSVASESSSGQKRRIKSAVIKPARQTATKKRRKVPICSELITSTDFSSDGEDQQQGSESVAQHAAPHEKLRSSTPATSSDEDTSDSEAHCTIASLIRVVSEQQNTSTSSSTGSNSSNSNNTTNNTTNSGTIDATSCSLADAQDQSTLSTQDEERAEDEEEYQEDEEIDVGGVTEHVNEEHNTQQQLSPGDAEDVSVTQAIPVGAEVEL
ncbi:E3 ubiquitin-protein ligase Topors-like [Uranotaenia lowii]|uniref:E3 ubiquitin-protein ligase Topors-like n=1 Tax=Uranotaenia lowii TaxID=190385 RepID=UPI00247AF9C0|nr:E3 ubiquitin-protein ligase Topors-like [Uranotaenia lowii]